MISLVGKQKGGKEKKEKWCWEGGSGSEQDRKRSQNLKRRKWDQ